jgi:[ribosomal protein S5]-alanine N-acetyltransferase
MTMRTDLGNCVIRSFEIGDAPSIARNANNKKVWINLRDRFPNPYTLRDAEEWVDLARSLDPESNFAIAVDGQVVGGVGVLQQTDVHACSAEFGYWLGETYWGRGIMTTVVKHMAPWYLKHFDLIRLYATVFAWNPASAKVLEKNGWDFEGRLKNSVYKDGKLCDQLVYATFDQTKLK